MRNNKGRKREETTRKENIRGTFGIKVGYMTWRKPNGTEKGNIDFIESESNLKKGGKGK